MNTLHKLAIPAVLLLLSGCGTTPGGVRGEVAFRATANTSSYISRRAPRDVARCFAETAQLLPFSLFVDDPDDGAPTYRLRYQDYWFEQIAFRAGPEGGTRVEVSTSSNYNGGWTTLLVRDRLGPLGQCMTPYAAWTPAAVSIPKSSGGR